VRRRAFLGAVGGGAGYAALTGLVPARVVARAAGQSIERHPLPRLAAASGVGLELVAQPAVVDIGVARTRSWTLNGVAPGPTIRLERGRTARIDLVNRLDEPTILHWHGLTVPQEADGHPRLAIDPGARYAYEFEVRDRAGTYWYHPHTHRRTAPQTYMGMAGLLIVGDDEERALALPDGEREIPLVLQDKRLAGGTSLEYDGGMGPDLMTGYLGDTPFGNGVAHPTLDVRRTTYRLRILNGSNARIFELGLSDGSDLIVIGSDGGLLDAPLRTSRLLLANGERADVLVDLSRRRPGDRVLLRSWAFDVPGMMGMMAGMRGRMGGRRGGAGGGMMGRMGGVGQGTEMDLLELVVRPSEPDPGPPLPARLSSLPERPVDADTPRRTFRFQSLMMSHTINGRSFELGRVDERVPIGRTEIWSFVNESELPHPVHVHVGQLRVLAREGGRGRVMPWERGLKDTVLTFPGERVDVAVRFDAYPGLFLLHCHNLEHEDMGMMSNFEVVA